MHTSLETDVADGDKESIEERIEFHLPSALQRCLVSFQKNSSHVCSGALVHPEIAIIIPTCEEILFHTIGIVHAVIGIVYSNRIYSSPVDKQSIKVDHKGGGALLEIFLIRVRNLSLNSKTQVELVKSVL